MQHKQQVANLHFTRDEVQVLLYGFEWIEVGHMLTPKEAVLQNQLKVGLEYRDVDAYLIVLGRQGIDSAAQAVVGGSLLAVEHYGKEPAEKLVTSITDKLRSALLGLDAKSVKQ